MDVNIHEDLTTVESISPFLKQCVGKGKEIPPGNLLQVQQVTNISFPTYDRPKYESDHHILKLTVTDGKSQGYALVADSCPGITLNTPPGTKIQTTQPIPVQGSLFILTRNNCEVIGGKVAKLFEKWEVQKRMAIKHEWGYAGTPLEGEGPPPWKPFGFKPSIDVSIIRKMKTTDVAATREKKDGQAGEGEKTQFDLQRDEAISELQAAATNKQFQKPKKHLLDKEITDIMDEGFSQEMAEFAMRKYKNSQKALKFLKDSKRIEEGLPMEPPKPFAERKDRRKKGKAWEEDEDDQHVPREFQRPNTNVSLFGFLQGHIKTDEKPKEQDPTSRELEDGMGRLNMEDPRQDDYYGRSDRGGRGRGGRGRGRGRGGRGRGGWDRDGGDSYRQRDYQSRPQRGSDRSYGSDQRYNQQEYQKPKEYQVPPQNCPETFPDLQDTRGHTPRQYANNNTERHEKVEHSRYNWQHRGAGAPRDSYSTNHSNQGYRNPPSGPGQYQNNFQDGWNPNPAQAQGYPRANVGDGDMGRGRGGGGYRSGRGGSSLNNFFNSRSNNMY